MTKQYQISKVSEWTEAVWVTGVSKEEYEHFKHMQLLMDRADGSSVLYSGKLIVEGDDPTDVVLCTESDHPAFPMFGYIPDEDLGGLFFDLKFFELVIIPQAREVGIWDGVRDSDEDWFPNEDWTSYGEIMDAISRAWPYPTLPEETI